MQRGGSVPADADALTANDCSIASDRSGLPDLPCPTMSATRQLSLASQLPYEVIGLILLPRVMEDTSLPNCAPVVIDRSVLWRNLEQAPVDNSQACVAPKTSCIHSGFLERALHLSRIFRL